MLIRWLEESVSGCTILFNRINVVVSVKMPAYSRKERKLRIPTCTSERDGHRIPPSERLLSAVVWPYVGWPLRVHSVPRRVCSVCSQRPCSHMVSEPGAVLHPRVQLVFSETLRSHVEVCGATDTESPLRALWTSNINPSSEPSGQEPRPDRDI